MDVDGLTATYESGPVSYNEFPLTDEPLCILGKQYSTIHDRVELKEDILSRIWFTYRRNFPPIGGMGPTSDQGWGCMLRCGQMILAQALVLRHLGREWRWQQSIGDEKETYLQILRLFQDKKSCVYSIHQIASMGESEGKEVGQWFGPNTVAQVLKKIVGYDDWSSLVIHVALDNTVIERDIREQCKQTRSQKQSENTDSLSNLRERNTSSSQGSSLTSAKKIPSQSVCDTDIWKPLLLIIPLRLGLTDINPVYFNSLKSCLNLESSVGIIGGKPNHAHWFIGYLGDELVYLDPHTTQQTLDLDVDSEDVQDDSFHCSYPGRMKISQLDPSMALGFFCGTETEFDNLCDNFRNHILNHSKNPMFEVHHIRPKHWPTFVENPTNNFPVKLDFCHIEKTDAAPGSDDEFEIIG